MSLVGFVDRAAGLIVLRKMVRRVRAIAKAQFTGGTRIDRDPAGDAAGHARRQGVHARRRDARAASTPASPTSQHEADKMGARRQPREPADGDARRLRDRARHRLWRLSASSTTARRRASSSRSSPRSCSPTSRPSGWRGSTSNSTTHLVGVRMLFEIIDSPATEPTDDDKPALKLTDRARRIRRRAVRLSRRRAGAARHVVRRRARQGDRAGRPVGRRQIDGAQSDPALLRGRRRRDHHRRPEHRRRVAPLAAPADRLCRPGRASCSAARCATTSRFGKPGASEAEIVAAAKAAHAHDFIMAFPHGYDTPVGEHGHAALRRPAPAHRDRARADQGRADHPARRGDRRARFRIRAASCRTRSRELCKGRTTHRDRAPALTPSCMPTASWWSRTARSSSPAGTTNCCARAAATPRSTGCNCRSRRRAAGAESAPILIDSQPSQPIGTNR